MDNSSRDHDQTARSALESATTLEAAVEAMWEEYMRDEECDYVVINMLIEVAYEHLTRKSSAKPLERD